MSKKISFPEPSCRYSCPHFKTVGSLLNETHYCMKKGKKGKRFLKKDSKLKPPVWCPLRLTSTVCRIYGFRDALQERLAFDEWLSIDPAKVGWYFPMSHRYQVRQEISLGLIAEQFYTAAQEQTVDEILNGVPVQNGELIEIDNGLAPYFFYVYNQATVFPAKAFGMERKTSQ